MRFLSDESTELSLTRILSNMGHDVIAVGVEIPSGIPDFEVITIAQRERRTLVTNDTDFGELIFRRGWPHAGVILLRLGRISGHRKGEWLAFVVTTYEEEVANGYFIVVTPSGIKVRHPL